jgi:flagellar hook-associated protein 3 FlgL
MRISTSWAQQTAVNLMLNQQSQLQQTQTEVSTGINTLHASDGPSATVSINNLTQSISQTQQYQSNTNVARQRLSMEDGVLQNATTILQQINELGIQGLNATTSASDKAIIANQMQGLNQQLLSLANTQNANGEYLFSGSKSTTPPFSQDATNPGAYDYAGNSTQRTIQVGTTATVTDGDPGVNVFGAATGPAPATVPAPGSITNIFEAISKFATDLAANTPNPASLTDISNGMNKILAVDASVGSRLNTLSNQDTINSGAVLSMQTALSAVKDVNEASAISQLNLQTVALQASQQAYSQVQKLSLFNYL